MVQLVCGSMLDVLREMESGSVDSVVTDPPYELGFMGKGWDKSGIAFSAIAWAGVLRVLKPGGHLLAFGGTRTYHRMTCAIEDAGFEVRDSLHWLYGSGFPKSLDVSKAIDKRGGQSVAWFGPWLRSWREQNGVTQKQIAALFPSKTGQLTGCVANWELGLNMPTADQFSLICERFGLPFESIEEAEREVIRRSKNGIAGGTGEHAGGADAYGFGAEFDITAPATDAARQWAGWGTALKPGHEPIVLARKPLLGTVAENVQRFGTGALNIDGCRIGTTDTLSRNNGARENDATYSGGSWRAGTFGTGDEAGGRWPANVLFDEDAAAELDEQSGHLHGPGNKGGTKASGLGYHGGVDGSARLHPGSHGDSGGASRFFYVAKPSRRERDLGCERLPPKSGGEATDREDGSPGTESPRAGAGRTGGARNHHPTVKPVALMRHLVRLVTPPGGVVLDPFLGSGTTGMAAVLEGFNFTGVELSPEYLEIARARIASVEPVLQRKNPAA